MISWHTFHKFSNLVVPLNSYKNVKLRFRKIKQEPVDDSSPEKSSSKKSKSEHKEKSSRKKRKKDKHANSDDSD